MLGRVVAMEQKELELQRQQLIIEDAENQGQLKDIEEKILHLLKSAEGNILDDEILIDTLADSKKTSRIIQEKVKVAELTQNRIAKVRQGYLPVAFRAAQLFFCIADLAGVDPMYQYSLDWYISLYESAIEQADKSKILEERLRNLNECFTYLLYKNVCRSLFEKDKLLFSFLLTTKIMSGNRTLDPAELRFFLQVLIHLIHLILCCMHHIRCTFMICKATPTFPPNLHNAISFSILDYARTHALTDVHTQSHSSS